MKTWRSGPDTPIPRLACHLSPCQVAKGFCISFSIQLGEKGEGAAQRNLHVMALCTETASARHLEHLEEAAVLRDGN